MEFVLAWDLLQLEDSLENLVDLGRADDRHLQILQFLQHSDVLGHLLHLGFLGLLIPGEETPLKLMSEVEYLFLLSS